MLGEVCLGEGFAFFAEPLPHCWVDGELFADCMPGEVPDEHVALFDLVVCVGAGLEILVAFV